MAKMTLKMLKLLPDNEMNVAGMLEWRRNEPKEFSFDDHVTGAQTNLRRTARPVIRLRPKFRHEIQVEAEHEGRQSDRSESLSGWPQRLRGQSEGREEAEADGANEDARQVAQKRGVRNHDLKETWIKKILLVHCSCLGWFHRLAESFCTLRTEEMKEAGNRWCR